MNTMTDDTRAGLGSKSSRVHSSCSHHIECPSLESISQVSKGGLHYWSQSPAPLTTHLNLVIGWLRLPEQRPFFFLLFLLPSHCTRLLPFRECHAQVAGAKCWNSVLHTCGETLGETLRSGAQLHCSQEPISVQDQGSANPSNHNSGYPVGCESDYSLGPVWHKREALTTIATSEARSNPS